MNTYEELTDLIFNCVKRAILEEVYPYEARDLSRDVLTAIETAGCRVVPRDPTLQMLNAGWEKMFGTDAGPTSAVWDVMISASPFAPPETKP